MVIVLDDRQEIFEISDELMGMVQDVMIECLESEGYDDDYEVSLSFVNDEEIWEINREYRGVDSPTDVLSFPLLTDDDIEVEYEEVSLGDIVVSTETAIRQAKEYNHSVTREICFLVCHSMFHLLGYDHMTEEEAKIMEEKQESVLNKLGITRDADYE